MDPPVLRVEKLAKRYNSGFSIEIPQLEFQAGKIYSLIGPNGAGKSTLLNILNLLEEATSGDIFLDGQKIDKTNALTIRRKMNLVMENPLLFHTTVYKNITSGLKFRAVDKNMWENLAAEALEMVGLGGFEKRYAPHLSRGETQRVAIARALVLNPEILFLDEPFTNIDQKTIHIIEELINKINQKHQPTIIFTTHDLSQAYRIADEVISLVDGRLVNGSLENFFCGEVEEADGVQFVRISTDISINIVTDKKGKVHFCIPPKDIILSYEPVESSARNSFSGDLKRIQLEGQVVRLVIKIDRGTELTALITKASYQKMLPTIGRQMFLTFKSTAVNIF